MQQRNKRLIAVLCWRDGGLVKSYRYKHFRPSVSLRAALTTLDRWEVDEIVILDVSRRGFLDLQLVDEIRRSPTRTPIAFGGGIRTESDVLLLAGAGCDRFVIESLMFDDPKLVKTLVDIVGRQALIGSLPILRREQSFCVWNRENFLKNNSILVAAQDWISSGLTSELLISSVSSEGYLGSFDLQLRDLMSSLTDNSVIWFGGIDERIALALMSDDVTTAVAIGNPLSESECVIPRFRRKLLSSSPQSVRRTRNS